ncbi:hypothetical protein CWB99_15825 [Pseudoalteromonas rubra]|uniref:Uncharacterized protein n=1 Tax=Pseudoalteromonas rubra TaxID=43658 RepID=A0A5S3WK24_9GAMM|nr:hypothetical protein CWB99_15825 [Pseudoalteromonas rubra]TMP29481.1 hypothetical protein CWC00_18920 [Pseudoalteromonas rubra]
MFANYVDELHSLNTWIWCLSLVAPILMFSKRLGSRSYYITAITWLITQFINLRIESYLFALSKEAGFIFWFGSWATIDAISITLIYAFHVQLKAKVEFEAMSVMIAYAFLGMVQIIYYFDAVVIQTRIFESAYQIAINTGNVVITLILTLPLCKALYQRLRSTLAKRREAS